MKNDKSMKSKLKIIKSNKKTLSKKIKIYLQASTMITSKMSSKKINKRLSNITISNLKVKTKRIKKIKRIKKKMEKL